MRSFSKAVREIPHRFVVIATKLRLLTAIKSFGSNLDLSRFEMLILMPTVTRR